MFFEWEMSVHRVEVGLCSLGETLRVSGIVTSLPFTRVFQSTGGGRLCDHNPAV